MYRLPRFHRWLIALGAALAPGGDAERFRREWAAEVWFARSSGRGELRLAVRTATCLIDAVWLWRREITMNGWTGDLRAAVRSFARGPALAAVMMLTLALGIGANAALFSVVNGVILQKLPVPEPEGLVRFGQQAPASGIDNWPYSYAQYRELSERVEAADLAVASTMSVNMITPDRAVRITAARVSDTFFPVTGLRPALGRVFSRQEEAAGAPLAVVSHEFWLEHLSGEPTSLGRSIRLRSEPYEVIGVLPPGTRLLQQYNASLRQGDDPVEVYVPMEQFGALQGDLVSTMWLLGRLRDGMTLERARSEVHAIMTEFLETRGREGWLTSAADLQSYIVGSARKPLWILMGAAGLLLVMVCANLSGLLLVRSVGRSGEWAARKALGASRVRLGRQLLTEGLLVSTVGGLLGLVVAQGAVGALRAGAPAGLPRVEELVVDVETVAFAAGLVLVTTVLFGLLPALFAIGRPPAAALMTSRQTLSSRGRRLLSGLVSLEVAMAIVLLAGSAVLLRSLDNLVNQDPGYSFEGVLRAQTELDQDRYGTDEEAVAFTSVVLDRLAALPGVEKAAASAIPAPTLGPRKLFQIDGLVGDDYQSAAIENAVSPEFFELLDIELVEGRYITAADAAGSAPVTVITRALAEQTWPGESAIGKRISTGSWRQFTRTGVSTAPVLREIVGVVEDLHAVGIDPGPPALVLYSPLAQEPWLVQSYFVRSESPPEELAPAVRAVLREVDPNQPLYDVVPAIEDSRAAIATERISTQVLSGFALAALLLSVLGVYGVVAYSVALRKKEIGIRMAVGASSGSLSGLFVREGLLPVALGMVVGVVVAVWAVQLLRVMLYEVSATDPMAFLAAGGVLALAAIASTYLPARRTAGVDPVEVLKGE